MGLLNKVLPKHIRFFKKFKILPGVQLNLSRHGISTTVGVPHAHVTWGKNASGTRKMRRITVGIPGVKLPIVGGIWRQWSKTKKIGPKKSKNLHSQTEILSFKEFLTEE